MGNSHGALVHYGEALGRIIEIARKNSNKGQYEICPLENSVGRVLSQAITSPEAVPSFDNSAMDGFAVRASDTISATLQTPVRLRVGGIVAAGADGGQFKFSSDYLSLEIMTGAPVPAIYDSVIRIEDVQVSRDSQGRAEWIELRRPARKGENIRLMGSDFQPGQIVLAQDSLISAESLLGLASLGVSTIPVKSRLQIALVSTGSELVDYRESNLTPGMIRNSTAPYLRAVLSRAGHSVQNYGIVRDQPELYRATLAKAVQEGAQVILSTGAVSMGQFDFVPEVLSQLNATTHFHKVAIRPGKPILFGEIPSTSIESVAFFGLPGNPVSTAVGFRFFVEPYLQTLMGRPTETLFSGRLTRSMSKPEGFRCFYKARIAPTENGIDVTPLLGQASYQVGTLNESNAWVIFSEEMSQLEVGHRVEWVRL